MYHESLCHGMVYTVITTHEFKTLCTWLKPLTADVPTKWEGMDAATQFAFLPLFLYGTDQLL